MGKTIYFCYSKATKESSKAASRLIGTQVKRLWKFHDTVPCDIVGYTTLTDGYIYLLINIKTA